MERLSRHDLELELALRISRALKRNAIGLRSKIPGAADKAADAVVSEIIDLIDSPSTCVVRASMGPPHIRAGQFGVDEPWPGEIVMAPRMQRGPQDGA